MTVSARKIGLFVILLDNLFIPGNYSFDFRAQYIAYLLFIVFCLARPESIPVNPRVIISLLIVTGAFLLVPLIKHTGVDAYLRQVILIYINLLFAYLLLSQYRFDVIAIFKDYIQFVLVASVVGIIQLFSQIIGFKYGADFSYLGFDMQHFMMDNWKIQSWFQEPSFLAIAFLPVVFVSIARFFGLTRLITKTQAFLVILVLVLSQSSSGLLGLVVSLSIIVFAKFSMLKSPLYFSALIAVIIFIAILLYQLPPVRLRVDDTMHLFQSDHVTGETIDRTNVSTYALYSNYKVTARSAKNDPIFGVGLGGHELAYKKYINEVVPPSRIRDKYPLNAKDANSMFLRFISELGLVGLCFMGFFFFRNNIRANVNALSSDVLEYWIINNSIFALIIIRLLRQGHYTMLGFMVFLLIYFFSHKYYNERTRSNE